MIYTTAAYLVWGLSPIFWKAIEHVPVSQLLAHRVVWCALLMVALLTWQRRWGSLFAALGRGRTRAALVGSTSLIAVNWLIYIWAVQSGKILEASLGYFINPLISVVLGLVFLGESLRRGQWVAVGLAGFGVGVLALRLDGLPWVALILALTFGFYGLLRKSVAASPEEGLAVETWLLAPLGVIWLLRVASRGEGAFAQVDLGTDVLLILTGAITAGPLIWFTHGARRLRLSTVGILQYLAPTIQFLLAILLYREPFSRPHLIAFSLIWTALAIYTVDARRARRQARAQIST